MIQPRSHPFLFDRNSGVILIIVPFLTTKLSETLVSFARIERQHDDEVNMVSANIKNHVSQKGCRNGSVVEGLNRPRVVPD